MKTALLFVNLRRFNALLPLLALLLMAVALAWAALTTDKPSPPKTVVPPGQIESLASDVLELRKLDNDLDLGPKIVMLKVISKNTGKTNCRLPKHHCLSSSSRSQCLMGFEW